MTSATRTSCAPTRRGHPGLPAGAPTVGDVMVTAPKTCPAGTTVAAARALFADDHVHALLVVRAGRLLAVVVRADLVAAAPDAPAAVYGRLPGRVADPDADLAATHRLMADRRLRRLAVVGGGHTLLGLLCLKRSGTGFCSDADVAARAADPTRH